MNWNFLDIKPGDEIKVGAIVAWREWRYRFSPLRLLSLTYNLEWPSNRPMEADPDEHHGGIFASKERPKDKEWAWTYNLSAGPYDGYVIGRTKLWGLIKEGPIGYRASYAFPFSFEEARGERADEAIDRLRRRFGV